MTSRNASRGWEKGTQPWGHAGGTVHTWMGDWPHQELEPKRPAPPPGGMQRSARAAQHSGRAWLPLPACRPAHQKHCLTPWRGCGSSPRGPPLPAGAHSATSASLPTKRGVQLVPRSRWKTPSPPFCSRLPGSHPVPLPIQALGILRCPLSPNALVSSILPLPVTEGPVPTGSHESSGGATQDP